MEKFLNQYDKEYMKMAMLKHEQTFREQVYELHRLYRIQKMLMNDIAKTKNPHYRISNQPAIEAAALSLEDSGGVNSELVHYDHGDLELTLGPRSYYQKKIKASEPGIQSETSFSNQLKGERSRFKEEQKWGPEMPVSNQERVNCPPWLLHPLTLNMST